jgi:hypothetical protein
MNTAELSRIQKRIEALLVENQYMNKAIDALGKAGSAKDIKAAQDRINANEKRINQLMSEKQAAFLKVTSNKKTGGK